MQPWQKAAVDGCFIRASRFCSWYKKKLWLRHSGDETERNDESSEPARDAENLVEGDEAVRDAENLVEADQAAPLQTECPQGAYLAQTPGEEKVYVQYAVTGFQSKSINWNLADFMIQ